ncbi:MAG TPA: Ig-like domain-containing protein [Verrucomicrobiae bacterium]
MKTKQTRIGIVLGLSFLVMVLSSQGAGYINNFDVSQDYVANGIIGDTNWDGVYLRFGDVPLADNGGDGSGNTAIANANVSFPGFLTVQSTATSWAAPGNDGFFLYKFVSGDFDAAVQVNFPFPNPNYHFAGLLARAATNSGAAFNQSENFVTCTRFQEFGIGEHVRFDLNGADTDGYLTSPGDDADLNTTHGVRITRVGDVFSFYNRTNIDAWHLMGTLTRPEWAGVPMQVGIQDAYFTGNSGQTYFAGFELSGPNVNFPAMPTAPSGLVKTASNPGGSLTLSWTPGNPVNSSLVVMRAQGNIQHNPVQGVTYTANSTFGDANSRLGGANEYVVFNGVGSSVTVTNLGGNNTTYSVAVYEYSGSGATTVYNTAAPATNSFAGPGIITSVELSLTPTNMPLGGAVAAKLLATFSTGESNVDQTVNTTWATSDSTVASVNTDGTVSALAVGTATITGTFGTFAPTATVTVHAPAFTDNFAISHDYVANGLQGSTWDGLYLNFGDIPTSNAGNEGAKGQTFVLDSGITASGFLSVRAAGGSWRVAGNDGPYLFKILTGDFQASVHVTCDTINFNAAGLMARLFDNSGGALQGGGGGANGTETHFNWDNPQQGIPSSRLTVDSGGTAIVNGLSSNDRWLLMTRVNSTNFLVFEKANATDPWSAVPAATRIIAEAVGNAPMQVGLYQEMRQATDGRAQFDTVMIDGEGILSPTGVQPPPPATNLTSALNADLSMTFNWVAADAAGKPVASILVMRDGGPVTAQPTYGIGLGANAVFGAGQNLGGGNYIVYKSPNSPTTTNNTVTVTGLTPGHVYYAAVYTYIGPFGTRVFNNVLPATGATGSLQAGTLQSITVLPVPGIPLGGLQVPQVLGVFAGGATVNVSAFATITVADTNVVQAASGALTGIGLGSTTAQIVYSGYTNVVDLTVRPPTFTDEFNANHDYLANRVTGTAWSGVYLQQTVNEVPDGAYVIPAGAGTVVADANISSNGVLTVTASGEGWEDANTGGFFLFKYVPGDFQMAIHINSFEVAGYNQPGLLARAYKVAVDGSTLGAAAGTTNTENWVSMCRFDEFGFGTYPRLNLYSAVQQSTQPDQDDGNFWLMIVRQNSTNFSFFKRATNTAPWQVVPNKTAYHQMEFAGAPMQVGIMAGPWTGAGVNRTVLFEHFMLDATTGSPLRISISGTDAVITWPPVPGTLQYTTSLSSPNWQPVGVQPTLSNGLYTVARPLSPGATFFRLAQ